MKTKVCTKCGKRKSIETSFHRELSGPRPGYVMPECKQCKKERYTEWLAKNRDYARCLKRKLREVLRKAVFEAYGNKCACCGETNRYFLAIDHVNGGGKQHRKITGWGVQFYRWVRDHNFPPDFQILCHNCNSAKYLAKICPHVYEWCT